MTDNNTELFSEIEGRYTESAEHRWRRFAMELVGRSSPDIVADAYAAAEFGISLSRLPSILIDALKKGPSR